MNPEEARKRLFGYLDDFLRVSHEKFMSNHGKAAKNSERRAWARVGKDCIVAYGKLLEIQELEQMAKDIEAIKAKVGI